VRPFGDEPNFFSTSARGSDFKSSFAVGFDLGFDSGALGWAVLGFMASVPSVSSATGE
jgi:hypothetical protein